MKILGKMQSVKPDAIDVYVNDSMGIFIPREQIDYTEVEHIHRGYEFVIPLKAKPAYEEKASFPYRVEDKTVMTERGKIFPFNPEQSHQAVDENYSDELLALFLETDFLEGLANSIYGVRQVNFVNYSFTHDVYLKNLLLTFIDEAKNRQGGYELITESIATQVGVYLLRRVKNSCPAPEEKKQYSNKKGINHAIEFIHDNYYRNFSLKEIAQIAHLSPYHFSRIFKAEIGKTPFEYLLEIKIEKAKEHLRRSEKSITEICFDCGFSNVSHFTRTFTSKVGVSPTTFRSSLR